MITKKQKQYLKGLANPLTAAWVIGKEGLTENIIQGIDEYLDCHELIKINVLKTCEQLIEEIVLDLITATHATLISQLGRKIVLYRKNNKQPVIDLPR